MTSHPSFEDLSAYHDGEAPEWAAHVGACARCQARLDQLAALTAAVARPLDGPSPAEVAGDPVERALAAAQDDGDASTAGAEEQGDPGPAAARPPAVTSGPTGPPAPSYPERGRWLAWVTAASAAAVLVLLVGVLALVNRSDGDRPTGAALTERGRAPGDQDAGTGAEPPGPTAAPESVPPVAAAGGDLGEVVDAETLVARAQPRLGGAPEAAPDARRAVGTYPCEVDARTADPTLGPVVYHATARVRGAPAVVLGFTPPATPGRYRVLALARADCRLLLSATSP